MLVDLNDLELCAKLFQDAFTYYQTTFPDGPPPSPSPELEYEDEHQEQDAGDEQQKMFGLMEILVLADSYNNLGQYDQAIHAIRQGCRWMQGRAAQRFWDALEDDREWDMPGAIFAVAMAEGGRVVGEGEVRPGMYPLEINARHRLALARLKMGDINEGKVSVRVLLCRDMLLIRPVQMHANIVLGQDIVEFAALFSEIADAYFERELYADACQIYELLAADLEVRLSLPTCTLIF